MFKKSSIKILEKELKELKYNIERFYYGMNVYSFDIRIENDNFHDKEYMKGLGLVLSNYFYEESLKYYPEKLYKREKATKVLFQYKRFFRNTKISMFAFIPYLKSVDYEKIIPSLVEKINIELNKRSIEDFIISVERINKNPIYRTKIAFESYNSCRDNAMAKHWRKRTKLPVSRRNFETFMKDWHFSTSLL
jgi:hypothetical protein